MTPLNKYREMAIRSNALKVAYAKSKNNLYLKEYFEIRDAVWSESGIDDLMKNRRLISVA
jgi:hypothetical protein